ncbi:hypothetical protein FRB96_002595 [Tulasnella sp. 330]|nr:hypothetical protein FRB96_002595 [Tulasnella sp. 330]
MSSNGDENGYPSHPRAKVNRYRNRAVYDYDFIHHIVNTASVLHVAFPPSSEEHADDPFPALLPMIGCMGRYDSPADDNDKSLDIYLHGYVSSRIMRLAVNAPQNEDGGSHGLPLTVSATLVDGIVLSLSPNGHSYNYRSAILHGFATPVTDVEEKVWAMRLVTNSVVSERWEHTRTPPTETELKTTQILRVKVVSASGKERNGQPHEDKVDLANKAVTESVWTGVIPVWEAYGAPVKAEEEAKSTVPPYLLRVLKERNVRNEEKAIKAIGASRFIAKEFQFVRPVSSVG